MKLPVQEPAIWACLAGMAACARELNTAEVAYAAINEVCVYVAVALWALYSLRRGHTVFYSFHFAVNIHL